MREVSPNLKCKLWTQDRPIFKKLWIWWKEIHVQARSDNREVSDRDTMITKTTSPKKELSLNQKGTFYSQDLYFTHYNMHEFCLFLSCRTSGASKNRDWGHEKWPHFPSWLWHYLVLVPWGFLGLTNFWQKCWKIAKTIHWFFSIFPLVPPWKLWKKKLSK